MNELDLFAAVIAIAEPGERAALLERECAGRPDLRDRIDQLVSAHFKSNALLDVPELELTSPHASNGSETESLPIAAEVAGTVIAGRYKLLQQIGEGGMGSVWMADQTEPVKRRVAVKLIRVERGQSRTILSRFEAERQAIAVMDHPHIAKLLDAGTTAEGSPFFVMELVKGIPLNDYCDEHKLNIRDRLQLFMQICSAVQHAHQKGIIHRDLKPTNILVENHDDKPVPKVIDFGLAKATSGLQLSEHTLFTAFGSVMGTPLYMAPEQANFSAVDIDTRADVYALGVILYELLTGTTPITRESMKKAALDEMLKLIREQDAPTPSSRLSTSESKPSIAANRQMEPQKLGRFVKGELDWIVMKALSKERDRRYETATGFARDVERFLNNEAVAAGPPSTSYRLRKFVKRNRGQVIAASSVLLALLAGIAGTTWGLIRAERSANAERKARVAAQADRQSAVDAASAEKAAKEQTQKRLAQIEKGNEITTAIFTDLDIRLVKAGTEPLEAVLAKRLVKAAGQLEGEAVGDPLVVAALQDRLGVSLLSLGHPKDAIPLFVKARETYTDRQGADHPDTLASMANLAEGYRAVGKLDLALPLWQKSLELRKAKLGADDPQTLGSMNNLAMGYLEAGKRDLALPLLEETLMLTKAKVGADHPDTLLSMHNLAMGYQAGGKLDLALPLLEETLKLRKDKLGVDHPYTLATMGTLAQGYQAAGKLDLALPLHEECLKRTKAKLGADHPYTLITMASLAVSYRRAGKLDLALPLLEESLKLMKAKVGADHPNTLASMNNLAKGYHAAGRLDLALPLFLEAVAGLETRRFQDENAGAVVNSLIVCHEQLKEFDQAEAWRRKWLAVVKNRSGPDSLPYAGELAALGLNLLQQKRWNDAEPGLRQCLAVREKKLPDDWQTFHTQSMLGGALMGQKKYADAEPLLLTGYQGMKQRAQTIPEPGKPRVTEALDALIELYTATNKPDEVKKWQAERAKYPEGKPAEKK